MQTRHVPRIDPRYWVGIIFASIFGTNLGDLYAHDSGLGLGLGLLVLLALFASTYLIEARDRAAHEVYYWLAIIIIRTGATNIADYLAFRVRVPPVLLVGGLAAAIAVFAWRAWLARMPDGSDLASPTLAKTGPAYWAAMLAAGVFGTALGDICSHHVGQGPASVGLGMMLAVLLGLTAQQLATSVAVYWCAVALARTTGTCIGDWLAENKMLHIGLPLSTLLTGAAFITILTLWRSARGDARAAA